MIRTFYFSVLCVLLLSGCRRASLDAPYPHESLLSIIAEAKIALRRDPYLQPPGRDLEGQNIFRVTLSRLDSVDELAGESYDDVLAFARAECHERLDRWGAAIAEYGNVIERNTSLATDAESRRAWAILIAEAASETTETLTLSAFINTLDVRRVAYLRVLEQNPPFPYDGLIRRALESNLQIKSRFLFDNRYLIPNGAQQSVESARKLVEENPKSCRYGENWLLLAGFYEGLARDYAQFNDPGGANFNPETWSAWMDQAREACRKAAQADGDLAKPEAQARLRSLDAYSLRILDSAR